MPNIIQDLKLKSDPSTIVNPNIVTDNIPSGAVTTPKIDSNAITTAKIADGAVTYPKIADNAISGNKIIDLAITTAKIADGAVTTAKIADGAVTWKKIAENTIIDNNIRDNAIHAGKLIGFSLKPADILGHYPTLQDLLDWLDTYSARELATIAFTTNKNGYRSKAVVAWKSSVPDLRIFYFNDSTNDFEMEKILSDSDYVSFVTGAILNIACNGVEEQ